MAWSQTDLEYLAGGSLWIQAPDRGQAQSQGPITGAQLLTSSSWIDLLQSLAVLNTVAVENRLYLSLPDTTFRPTFASFGIEERFVPGDYELLYSPSAQTLTLFRDGLTVDSKRPGERLGTDAGFDWTPPVTALTPETRIAFSVTLPRVVASEINRNLVTRLDGTGAFIRVQLRGKTRLQSLPRSTPFWTSTSSWPPS